MTQTDNEMADYLNREGISYKKNGRIFITKDGSLLPKRIYGKCICIYNTDQKLIDSYNYDLKIVVFDGKQKDPVMIETYNNLVEFNMIKRVKKYDKRHITVTRNQYTTMSKYATLYGVTFDALIQILCDRMEEELNKSEKEEKKIYH